MVRNLLEIGHRLGSMTDEEWVRLILRGHRGRRSCDRQVPLLVFGNIDIAQCLFYERVLIFMSIVDQVLINVGMVGKV